MKHFAHLRQSARRGATLLICIGFMAVLGLLAHGVTNRYIQGRMAQRRTEIARAERLLQANALTLARMALRADVTNSEREIEYGDEYHEIALVYIGDTESDRRTFRVTARGFHPEARFVGSLSFDYSRPDGRWNLAGIESEAKALDASGTGGSDL